MSLRSMRKPTQRSPTRSKPGAHVKSQRRSALHTATPSRGGAHGAQLVSLQPNAGSSVSAHASPQRFRADGHTPDESTGIVFGASAPASFVAEARSRSKSAPSTALQPATPNTRMPAASLTVSGIARNHASARRSRAIRARVSDARGSHGDPRDPRENSNPREGSRTGPGRADRRARRCSPTCRGAAFARASWSCRHPAHAARR